MTFPPFETVALELRQDDWAAGAFIGSDITPIDLARVAIRLELQMLTEAGYLSPDRRWTWADGVYNGLPLDDPYASND